MLRKIRIYICFILFLILTIAVHSCPGVTRLDEGVIAFVQKHLALLPLWMPMLPDCILYTVMIIIPLTGFAIFFIKRKLWKDLIFLFSIPLITFLLNCIIKPLIKRPRPPIELQITGIHPDSYSYVSSHSLVTFCLWGMVIFYLYKYSKNQTFKISGTMIALIWILFVGLSRVWLGVHNPTDVLGAYILGLFLLSIYVKFI